MFVLSSIEKHTDLDQFDKGFFSTLTYKKVVIILQKIGFALDTRARFC